MQLKWAIIGTGNICRDFAIAMSTCDPAEHQIVAVGSRDENKAQKFAADFKIPKSYGTYEAAMLDPNVDIVYIGTIEQIHRDLCLKAFQAKRHVLCEKPLGMNSREVEEINAAAKKSGKFFLEAMWSRFFPVYDDLREAVKNIGTVMFVDCTFCVPNFGDKIWSILMSIGCYPLQAALLAFQHEQPEKVIASGHVRKLENGELSDSTANITLLFKNNRMAVLNIIGTDMDEINSLRIYGSKGTIEIPNYFWNASEIKLPTGEVIVKPLPVAEKPTYFARSVGLRYEAIACREYIMAGKTEHPFMTQEHSLMFAKIIEEARRQILESASNSK